MEKTCVIFVTSDSPKTSKKITDVLLKKRFAACVNRVHGIISSYWWKGKIEKAKEDLLIIKTKISNMDRIIKEVKRVHPYTVPEVIAFNIEKGNRDYIDWIIEETV